MRKRFIGEFCGSAYKRFLASTKRAKYITLICFGLIIFTTAFVIYHKLTTKAEGSEYTTGLTSWWKMNESSGSTTADSSGNSHTGNLNGNAAFSSDVPNSSSSNTHSILFDGTGDYVQAATPGLPTGSFTYTLWVKPTAAAAGTILESADGAGGDEFQLSMNASGFLVLKMDNTTISTGATALTAGAWSHVAVVRAGTTVTVYVNGVSYTTGTKATVLGFSSCPLFIGTDVSSGCSGGLGTDFNGRIDDVRVYDRALDTDLIRQIADLAAPGGVFGKLTMWLDTQDSATLFTSNACTGAATTGNTIGCWKDKSGAGNNATQATGGSRPTLLANEVGGTKPSLDFTSQYLQTAGTPIGTTANLPYTKFVVFKYDSSAANNIIGGTATTAHQMWGNTSSTNMAVTHNGVTVIPAATSSVDTTRYYIGTVRYGAPVGILNEINIDGVQKSTSNTNSTYASTATQIGAVAGTNFLDGKVAEAIAYNRALSDSEVASVECYLSSHWGITVSGCSSYLNIAQPVQYKTFQRDGSNKADIPINGATNAVPCSSVEASFNGGGYQTIDASVTNGQYGGVLTNQDAGQGTLTVRCTDNTSVSATSTYVGIGDVFLVAGQSNATGQLTNMQNFSHPTLRAAAYDATAGWKIGNDDTDFDSPGKGSFWPLVATKIMAQTGYPVAFITTGIGSTCLVCTVDSWNKAGNATSYNSMLADLTASGVNSVKAVLWHQGETDAQFATTRVNMKAGLDSFADNIAVDVPGSPKIVASNIGEVTAATVANVNNIRLAIQDAWDTNAKFVAGPSNYDLTTGDGVHFVGDTQAGIIADRWWASLKTAYYGGTEDGRGPRLTSVQTNSAKTKVILTFNDNELPLLPLATFFGITIKDAGVTKTQTSAVRLSNNKIQVNLTSAATGAVTASVGAGTDGKGLINVTDSSTYNLPAETAIDVAATVASAGALPSISYSGRFQEPTANAGTATGSIVATLTDDTFAASLALNSQVTVSNVPAGLTAVVTRNSSTQATFTLTGNATSHADINDVNNLTITWLDGSLVTNSTGTSSIPGYQKSDGIINFRDVAGPGGISSNLLLWLDAKVTTSISNSPNCDNQALTNQEVACWKDQSDSGNDVLQSLTTNRPNLLTTDANGSPALDFNIDFLKTAANVSAANSAYTKFVVLKNTSGGNVFSSYVNGNAQTLGISGTNVFGYHNYAFIDSGASAIDTASYHIVTLRNNLTASPNNVIKVDGVQKVTNASGTIYSAGAAQIGGAYNGVNLNYVGKVAEAVLYSGAMSDANISAVECYMATKWSITNNNCAPTITSIVRQTPTSATTNSDTPTFRVTFSGSVQNVDTTDFTTNGTAAGAGIASVTVISPSVYDIQISGLTSANGTVNLDVTGGNNIQSLGSVALSSTTPTGADETYTMDNTAPSAPGITSLGGDATNPYYSSDTTPDFVGTGSEDGATVTVKEGVTTLCTTVVASGTWTCTSSALSEAAHNLSITLTDTTGNEGSAATPTLNIDATPPATPGVPDMTSGTDSGSSTTDNTTSDTTPDFAISCEDNATVLLRESSTTLASGTCSSGTVTLTSSVLSEGAHSVYSRQTDPSGNTSTDSSTLAITIDTSSPAASGIPDMTAGTDSGTSSTDDITSDTTPDFTVTCEVGATVLLRESSTTLASGTCSSSPATLTSSVLSSGAHSVYSRQTDLAGNTSTDSSTLSITIDATAPSASGTPDMTAGTDSGSSSTDNITSNTTPDFTVTCEVGATVLLRESSTTLATGTCASSPLTLTASALTAGGYSVYSRQTDPSGNTSTDSSTLSITIDTSASAAPGTPDLTSGTDSGSSNSDNLTNDTTPDLTITCVSGETVDLREGSTTLATGTCASSTVTLTSSTLTTGAHTLVARQTDAAGNVSANSAGLTVTIDTTTPSAPVATSLGGDSAAPYYSNDTTPDFVGSASEDGTTLTVKESSTTLCTTTVASSAWSCTSSVLTQAAHSLTIYLTDAAGNDSTSLSPTLNIDTTAPSASGTPDMTAGTDSGSSSTDNITSNTTPDFTVTCEVGATVLLRQGSTTLASGTCSSSPITLASSTLTSGSYSVYSRQTDQANNTSTDSSTLSITIDTAAPTAPTITSLGGDTTDPYFSNDITPDFVGTGENGATVTVKEGVTTLCTATVSGGTWTCTSSTLTEVTHSLTISQTDPAGNVSSGTAADISISTALPSAPGTPDMTAGTDSGSSSTDNITSDTTPDFTISCVSGDTVDLREGSTTLASGLCVSSNVTLTSTVLSGGAHTIKARQTDGYLNVSPDSSTLGITIDTTASSAPGAPDMTAGTDSGGSNTDDITNDTTPDFTITCVSGETVDLRESTTTLATGTCASSTVTLTSSTLSAGVHTLSARQTDPAGNISTDSSTLSLTIDTAAPAAPAVTSLGGDSSDPYTTSDNTPDFVGTGENGATVTVKEGVTTLCTATVSGGTWTCTSTALIDGVHNLTIYQTDTAGNVSTSITPSISTSTGLPAAPGTPDMTAATDSGSSNSDNITSDTTPDFTVSCISGYTVDLREGATSLATGTCVSSTVTLTSSVLSQAGHSIYANQTDLFAITSSDSSPLSVTIDATASAAPGTPDMTAGTDSGSSSTDNITSNTTPLFTISCASGDTVDLREGSTTLASSACVSSTVTILSSMLADGSHTLTSRQTDAAGNVSSNSAGLSITIDTAAPTAPTITSLGGDSSDPYFSNDTTPDFVGTGENGTTATVKEGGTTLCTATVSSGTWTCTSSTLADGAHSLTVTLIDPAGNVSSSTTPSITIDTVAPAAPGTPDMTAATDSGSSSTDNITSNTTPDFTVTCEVGATVLLRQASTTLASGACTASPLTLTSSALAAGTYSVYSRQSDTTGNTSTDSSTLSVTVDTTTPATPGIPDMTTGTDSGSSSTDNITSDTTPDFTISCETGTTVLLRESTTTLATGTCASSTVTLTSSTLSQAAHSVYSRQSDTAGNTSADSAALSLTVDATAPAIVGITSLGGDTTDPYFSSDTTPDFVGTGESGTTVIVKEGSTTLCSVTVSGGTWTCTSSTLTDGAHSLSITQVDSAGNISTAVTPSLTVDTAAPSAPGTPDLDAASDTGSSNTDNLTGDATPSLTVACETGATVILREGSTTLATGTCASSTVTLTSSTLADGAHTLTARQTDQAGNVSTVSSGLTVTINTTTSVAPTVTTPVAGTTTESAPTFSGTGTDDDLITVLNGTTTLCTAIVAGGEWACVISPLADGTYTFSVTATNNLGNPSPATSVGPYVLSTASPAAASTDSTPTTTRAKKEAPIATTVTETTLPDGVLDTDGDGSPDSQELAGPNQGDGNNDGIQDSTQKNVKSVFNDTTRQPVTMEVDADCTLTKLSVVNYDLLAARDNARTYPVGLNAFTTTCGKPGIAVMVKVYLEKKYDTARWKLAKYYPDGRKFEDMTGGISFTVAKNGAGKDVTVINYAVKDGGTYDLDGKADGNIVDPAGPAIEPEAEVITKASHWWWLLAVLGLMIFFGGYWHHKRKQDAKPLWT